MDEYSIDRIIQEEDLKFATQMHDKYVPEGKICDGCKVNKALRINRWGSIKAFCNECLKEEYSRFEEQCHIGWEISEY